MGATVVITSQAWEDLSEIIDYIAKDNPDRRRGVQSAAPQKEIRLFFEISV